MPEFVLELRGIKKTFPGVTALDQVHFQLKPGEIHALMGENGAGKSTLIKIITGVHPPDEGEILLYGVKAEIKNPRVAQEVGIAAIYQHVTSFPDLSVTENIFIGHEKVQKGTRRLLWNEMHTIAGGILQELGANIDPRMQMGALSIAEQQIVEVAKALSTDAKIIIMDEPTAALTKRESEELYRITEQLKRKGVSILFITHRFEDMHRLADRVTVFRDGKYIGTWGVQEISQEELIVAMVGREIKTLYPKKEKGIGEEILRVEKLGKTGFFADISFTLHRGEILGLTGLVGAGRSEVCQAIFGITSLDKGKIFLEGKEVNIKNPRDAINLGIGYLPEDRQKQGLILDWQIDRNISLLELKRFAKYSWLLPKREVVEAKTLAEKLNVKAKSIFDLVGSLSGGNQQKVVFAKFLSAKLKIIILDEPTKGVDIGAKTAIYEMIHALAEQGYGVVLISSEMPEIIGLSDRIVVMREGRVTAILKKEEATQEIILEASMMKTAM